MTDDVNRALLRTNGWKANGSRVKADGSWTLTYRTFRLVRPVGNATFTVQRLTDGRLGLTIESDVTDELFGRSTIIPDASHALSYARQFQG